MAWIAPDDVLPRALRVVASHAHGPEKVCVVRDVKGRVRVAVAKGATNTRKLEEDLNKELRAWFAGPVVAETGSPAHVRIAREILKGAGPWPTTWPSTVEMPDGRMVERPTWLLGRVVSHSKESWLTAATPPAPEVPRIVSFYSFKGGVGRTTTLGCVAARLATDRKLKVVAVDLDLEAPGVGSFLGVDSGTPGVVDHVLSHLATGEVGDVDPRPVDGFPGLWVVGAGHLGSEYIEKLARLDFLASTAHGPASPTEDALRALLSAIAVRVNADIILLDSRAGLHDLGGLALHRLSHSDILVARSNAQAREGMAVVLGAIRRLRPIQDRDVHIVQTMVPSPFDNEVARVVIDRWKHEMYEVCSQTIYEDLDELPALEDETAHFPLLVPELGDLVRVDKLEQVPQEYLPRFDRVADAVEAGLSNEGED